ncbi:MAG TPA: hypothetical protein VGB55_14865 [Tepidisphaeraceae bacterium]
MADRTLADRQSPTRRECLPAMGATPQLPLPCLTGLDDRAKQNACIQSRQRKSLPKISRHHGGGRQWPVHDSVTDLDGIGQEQVNEGSFVFSPEVNLPEVRSRFKTMLADCLGELRCQGELPL